MDIVLIENISSLGFVGDVVKVKRGYARNWLIPQGKAIEAGSKNGKLAQHKMFAVNAKKMKLKAEAEVIAQKLSQIHLEFTARTVGSSSSTDSAGNKTYGSITQKEIEAELLTKGFEIDRKLIKLTDPLKTVGTHNVSIKLHSEVVAQIVVNILAEVRNEESNEKSAKGKDRKPRARVARSEDANSGAESATEAKTEKKASRGKKSATTEVEE